MSATTNLSQSPSLGNVATPPPTRASNGSRPQGPMLSLGRAADALGVSQTTMRRICDEGDILTVVLPSGHRRISQQALNEYMGLDGGESNKGRGCGIAAYCRVSSEKQNQRGSLDRQKARLTKVIVEREGVEAGDIEIYAEICSSYSNREILNRLILDIINGGVSVLYCENEDRLSRISSTTSLVYFLCKQYGTKVVCLDRDEQNEDELEAGMKELLAHAGIITARIHAKKSALVTRKALSGSCIQRIIELRHKGRSLVEIEKVLHKEEYVAKTQDGTESKIGYGIIRRILDENGVEDILSRLVVCKGKESSATDFITSRIMKRKEGDRVTVKDVYPHYKSYCEEKEVAPKSKSLFGRIMVKTLPKSDCKEWCHSKCWAGWILKV